MRKITLLMISLLMVNASAFAVDETEEINLRGGNSRIDKAIYAAEDAIVMPLTYSSLAFGKAADAIVYGGKTLGTVLFRPIFKPFVAKPSKE